MKIFPSIASASALLLVCQSLGCQKPAAVGQNPAAATVESGPAVIRIGTAVVRTEVKRLGINLSGQTFYDSGQMLRNLAFRNPGFEGETWQSILHCKSVTGNTCTDENEYAVWPAGFLDGATVEVLSGHQAGTDARVERMQPAGFGQGVTVTLAAGAKPLSSGDFILVRLNKPGNAQAGWWTDLKGGATLATEFKDLSPHTPGHQALRIQAAEPDQSATISSFFDSYEGRSFVQLHGRYTISFRARALAGANSVDVQLQRLDTAHGLHSFFHQTVPLSSGWTDYSFSFNAAETGAAVGTVGLSFRFAGSTALLDDVALTADAAPGNKTAFRNEVVETLRDLHPGVLRYMDNGTDFGSSLDNMLAVPFARQRAGASEQETVREDIPLGLHEFLTLCAAIGAEPWYAMPAGTSPREAAQLTEYLAGNAGTPYGAKRAALGQRVPWTSVFPVIHLELGNEQWNHRSFAGAAINDPVAYGSRGASVYRAARSAPAYRPTAFDLILGSWATVPWWSGQEMASASAYDSLAVAPYLFNEFNDAASIEAVFGPMFAEPELIDSRPNGYMAQQATAARARQKTGLAVYEVNLGTMGGSTSQQALNATVPSMGAGLAVVDHMLLMLRDLGVTTQCLFALPEFVNDFNSTTGPKKKMALWGAVVDMGGPTNNRRPQFLAMQMANQAVLPTMLETKIGGTPLTWDQPASANGKIEGKGLHLLQSFAFADGNRRSLIVLNLSRDRALPVRLAGPQAPTGHAERRVLTAASITANNESSRQVQLAPAVNFDPQQPLILPPYSMTVLTWTQPGGPDAAR